MENEILTPTLEEAQPAPQKPKKRSFGRVLFCFFRRTLLLILVLVCLVVAAAALACNAIFNGPSQEAREKLFYCFYEPSGTKWIPGLFLSEAQIDAIKNKPAVARPTPEVSTMEINTDFSLNTDSDEWKDCPDGIRIIRNIKGDTYTAHLMIIRDPARVYLGTSSKEFSEDKPGAQLHKAMEKEGAVAAINGGAFWDDGKGSAKVGTMPEGIVISGGALLWNHRDTYSGTGFAGFNEDNVLIVAKSMTVSQARELKIRDGCTFGPVLIMDGQVNQEAYNKNSGLNPRTCIAQRADGAVIFLCIDGRQANSLGGTYSDAIDILVEYGAVNAYNLDGGSSTAMFYRDDYGRYGEKGEILLMNNYSLLQTMPRNMPTFYMVAPEKEVP